MRIVTGLQCRVAVVFHKTCEDGTACVLPYQYNCLLNVTFKLKYAFLAHCTKCFHTGEMSKRENVNLHYILKSLKYMHFINLAFSLLFYTTKKRRHLLYSFYILITYENFN